MSRSRHALFAILYALVIDYVSTIVGVVGPHFVPIDPAEALRQLIHMPYVEHGSDQRSDWMGNLIMLVPLGFLVAGWRGGGRIVAAVTAFPLCFAFILLVKYAQLYFPPRIVTLNYVLAQSIGALIGIALFALPRSPLAELRRDHTRLESLRTTLWIYAGLLILFMLLPLDFALNADDISRQLGKLPDTVFGLNGEDRPALVRIAVAVAGMAATAPLGGVLTLVGRGRIYVGRSTSAVAWIGCFMMLVVYALTALVISGNASLLAVVTRTIGIALGSWFMHWLTRQNPDDVRDDLGDLVPRAVPIYLLTLFGVNGLLALDWNSPQAAYAALDHLSLLPLFNYYIVSKAQAAKNIVGHVAMYAPIGVMLWLRLANRGSRIAALVFGLLLSAIVESGRFLRPGLAPDINAVPLAAVSAWAAAALMPAFWRMLSAVPLGRAAAVAPRGAVPGWRDRGGTRHARRRDRHKPANTPAGDVEHY